MILLLHMLKEKIKKHKTKIIVSLIILIVVFFGAFVIFDEFVNPIPKQLRTGLSREFHCMPDACSSINGESVNGKINIYLNIESERQCIKANGNPILSWGISGEEFYKGCAVK